MQELHAWRADLKSLEIPSLEKLPSLSDARLEKQKLERTGAMRAYDGKKFFPHI